MKYLHLTLNAHLNVQNLKHFQPSFLYLHILPLRILMEKSLQITIAVIEHPRVGIEFCYSSIRFHYKYSVILLIMKSIYKILLVKKSSKNLISCSSRYKKVDERCKSPIYPSPSLLDQTLNPQLRLVVEGCSWNPFSTKST